MPDKTRLLTTTFFSLSFALTGCLKSGEEATGVRSESPSVLDADHGGARIVLPDIDPAVLGKAGTDTAVSDTAKGWFELSITGENMPGSSYKFPLWKQGSLPIEIKGIPAGKKRSFHGWLVNGKGITTHEGITLADIQGGAFTDIRLYLAKVTGSAAVCVVVEGQALPPCSSKDTLTPPPDPKPGPGTTGSIPMPGSGAGKATLCFELRFDYANSACEIQGASKMDFQDGKILFGDMVVADKPVREYTGIIGTYDSSAISFYGITQPGLDMSRDTLSLQGHLSLGATMAKGEYVRLPSGKKGIWTMTLVACGAWTPKYPDPSCTAVH